jgi:hypothetical protein
MSGMCAPRPDRLAARIHQEQAMIGFSSLCGLLCASLALAAPAGAARPAGKFTPACARYDLRVIAFIEQHGEAGDIPTAVLAEAGRAHLQARLNCLLGNEAIALAMYDRILRMQVASAPED